MSQLVNLVKKIKVSKHKEPLLKKVGDLSVIKLIFPHPAELQLFEDKEKSSANYTFYKPVFAGDFLVKAWKTKSFRNKKLFALELFGNNGVPIKNADSQHWENVKQFEWAKFLNEACTTPLFTKKEMEHLLLDLYKASPSSYEIAARAPFKKMEPKNKKKKT